MVIRRFAPTPLAGVRALVRNQSAALFRPHPACRGGARVQTGPCDGRCQEPALHPGKRGGGEAGAVPWLLVTNRCSTPTSGVGAGLLTGCLLLSRIATITMYRSLMVLAKCPYKRPELKYSFHAMDIRQIIQEPQAISHERELDGASDRQMDVVGQYPPGAIP